MTLTTPKAAAARECWRLGDAEGAKALLRERPGGWNLFVRQDR